MSASIAMSYKTLPKIFAVLAILVVAVAFALVTPDSQTRLQHLLADGDLGAALAIAESEPEVDVSNERALADRIDLYLALGRPNDALALTDRVLSVNRTAQWAMLRKTEIVESVGSFEDRVAWARETFAFAPNQSDFRFLLGAAQIAGDIDREADILETARAHSIVGPSDIERLALIRASQGALEEAVTLLEYVVTQYERPTQRARLTLFSLMTQLGQTDRAIDIARTTGLDPADASSVALYASQSRGAATEQTVDKLIGATTVQAPR